MEMIIPQMLLAITTFIIISISIIIQLMIHLIYLIKLCLALAERGRAANRWCHRGMRVRAAPQTPLPPVAFGTAPVDPGSPFLVHTS